MTSKLELNQRELLKRGMLKVAEVTLVQNPNDSKRWKMCYCLNCGFVFRTTQESQFIFCSADCSTEYYKKKKGLI